ncbi:hypothetical protein K438DRAFT_1579371 [Mycena galopus ATCC 62051]|nr:hypothetical protein K438DRAFT_1579371 [Mycena galopus ATCC 62051]
MKKNKLFDVIPLATSGATKCGSHSAPHAIRATGSHPVALVAHRNLSIALATFVSARGCPEASRFGNVDVSPAVLSPGDTFTVTANLTCAIQLGNTPTFLEYHIAAAVTDTDFGPILIARRTYDNSTSPRLTSSPRLNLPDWFYVNGTVYSVLMKNSFACLGPTNDSVITTGGIYGGFLISLASSHNNGVRIVIDT